MTDPDKPTMPWLIAFVLLGVVLSPIAVLVCIGRWSIETIVGAWEDA
jgi:hypothetical protein